MLDERVADLLKRSLSLAFEKRRRLFAEEVTATRLRLTAAGFAPGSGALVEVVIRVAVEEARLRFNVAGTILKQLTTNLRLPASDALATDLKAELDQVHTGDLLGIMRDGAANPAAPLARAWGEGFGKLQAAIAEARREAETEIDLAMESGKRQASADRLMVTPAALKYLRSRRQSEP